MAEKMYFIIDFDKNIIEEKTVEYTFKAGFAIKNKQENIKNIHKEIFKKEKENKILEVSSKSLDKLGVDLSAFNLSIETKKHKKLSVETIFQASKVFENGKQYKDLLDKTSREAKKDERLRNSGKIIEFCYNNQNWKTEPKTLFYDWLYINSLYYNIKNLNISKENILKYKVFTDVEFNHKKSINCQARAIALYVLMEKNNILEECLNDKDMFEKYLKKFYNLNIEKISNIKKNSLNKIEVLKLF